ncbi:hypothetical protein LTR95_008195 [Oleoguttula sp. CCFEE 5521]
MSIVLASPLASYMLPAFVQWSAAICIGIGMLILAAMSYHVTALSAVQQHSCAMKMAYFVLSFVLGCLIDICSTWPIDWTIIGISLLAGFALASWFVDAIINDDPGSFKVYAHFVVDKCAYISSACRQLLRLVLASFGLALLEDKTMIFDSFVGLAESFLGLSDCLATMTASRDEARKDNGRLSRQLSLRDAEYIFLLNKIRELEQGQASSTLQHEAAMREMGERLSHANAELRDAQSNVRISYQTFPAPPTKVDDNAVVSLQSKLDDAEVLLFTRESEIQGLKVKMSAMHSDMAETHAEVSRKEAAKTKSTCAIYEKATLEMKAELNEQVGVHEGHRLRLEDRDAYLSKHILRLEAELHAANVAASESIDLAPPPSVLTLSFTGPAVGAEVPDTATPTPGRPAAAPEPAWRIAADAPATQPSPKPSAPEPVASNSGTQRTPVPKTTFAKEMQDFAASAQRNGIVLAAVP